MGAGGQEGATDDGVVSVSVAPDGSIVVGGEIDAFTAAPVETALERAVAERSGDVVVDLAGVTFLDSGGLNVLIRCHKALDPTGRRIVLRHPQPAVRRALEIGGVFTFAVDDG